MLTHRQLRAKALSKPEVKAAFEKLGGEYALLDEFLKARSALGLTQAQLAQIVGTTQSAVARMESVRIQRAVADSPPRPDKRTARLAV